MAFVADRDIYYDHANREVITAREKTNLGTTLMREQEDHSVSRRVAREKFEMFPRHTRGAQGKFRSEKG